MMVGIFVALTVSGARAEVWLNEVYADPPGADAGAEWVELGVDGDADLTGWGVEAATAPDAWKRVAELGPVEAGWVVVPTGALGNAGTDADAVRLVDGSGAVVDALTYGADAARLFPGVDALVGRPDPGHAAARVPDGGARWSWEVPSPGGANPEPPPPCVPPAPGAVAWSEAHVDPSGPDAGAEWVELRVADGRAHDVAGWAIEQAGAPDQWGARVRFVFPRDAVLGPADVVVVADAGADVGARWWLPEGATLGLGNGEDAVRLVDCVGREVSTLAYGGADPDGFVDDDTTVAPAVREGGCLAWVGDDDPGAPSGWRASARCTPGVLGEATGETGTSPPLDVGCAGPPTGAAAAPPGGCRSAPGAPAVWALPLLFGVRRTRRAGAR